MNGVNLGLNSDDFRQPLCDWLSCISSIVLGRLHDLDNCISWYVYLQNILFLSIISDPSPRHSLCVQTLAKGLLAGPISYQHRIKHVPTSSQTELELYPLVNKLGVSPRPSNRPRMLVFASECRQDSTRSKSGWYQPSRQTSQLRSLRMRIRYIATRCQESAQAYILL
jgi:hypothetical protein